MPAKVKAATNKTAKVTKPKKSKLVKEAATEKIVAPVVVVDDSPTEVTEQVFLVRLREKLSHFDAQMVLEAAMLTAGVQRSEGFLKKTDTRNICLALIKRGGPAFSVGTNIYREVIG